MHLRNFQRQCDVPMCVHTLGRTSTTLSYSWLSQIWCHLRNWLATCHERIRGLVSASWRPSCCSKVLGLGPPIAWNFSISSPWFLPPQLGHKEVWPVAQSPWRHVLPQLVHKEIWPVAQSLLGASSACPPAVGSQSTWARGSISPWDSDAESGSLNLPQSLVIMLVIFHFLIFFIQQCVIICSHLCPFNMHFLST